MSYDVSCLYSVIKNISGETLRFNFLAPRGTPPLADDEEYSIPGNVVDAVCRKDRSGSRNFTALKQALQNQMLEIRSTPSVILEDLTTGDVQQIVLDSGSLDVASPCWEVSLTS